MHKLSLAFFLAAAVTAAYAQNTVPASTDADKSTVTAQSTVNSDATKELLGRRNCLAETGSHIVRKDGCVNAAGRGYGRTAIDHTSTLGNTAEALEQLDTAVQIRVR
jgi:hypothetical protein